MRWRSRTAAAVLAAALAVVGVAAPASAHQERSPKITLVGDKLPKGNARTFSTDKDPVNGMTAPTLTGQDYDGNPVTFQNDGKARVVLFLSHSCPHCQAEVPRIVKLAKQEKLAQVEIDTVTTNTYKQLPNYPPSKWLKREHWPFTPIMADDSHLRAFLGYGGQAFPYFVFVSADGTIAGRFSGEIPPKALAEVARRLAAGESLYQQ